MREIILLTSLDLEYHTEGHVNPSQNMQVGFAAKIEGSAKQANFEVS